MFSRAKIQSFIKKDLVLAVCVVLVGIAVVICFGWENNKVVPINAAASAHYTQTPQNPLKILANWDGSDYLVIAQHSYTNSGQTNFFPLYPLVVHIVELALGSPLMSGLLVSWVSLVGAVYFYLKIIKKLFNISDGLEALRGLLFFVLFPTGVFLFAVYTESLFAFLALGAIYAVLRKSYLPAVLFAMLATATHVNGVLVVILLALLMLEQKEKILKVLAVTAAGISGLLVYMIFLQARFHNALAFVGAQKSHGWLHYSYIDFATEIASLDGLFLLVVFTAGVYWWPRRRSFAIYSWLYVGIALLGGLGAFARYSLMVFPLQLMFYDYFRHKKLGYSLALAAFAIFWAYFMFQYVGGYVGGG